MRNVCETGEWERESRPHRPLPILPFRLPFRRVISPREAAEARLVRPTVAGRGASSSRLVSR